MVKEQNLYKSNQNKDERQMVHKKEGDILPSYMEEKTIAQMVEGEIGFAVSWVMVVDSNRRLYIDGKRSFGKRPHGTESMKIQKLDGMMLVEEGTIDRRTYKPIPLPIDDTLGVYIPAKLVDKIIPAKLEDKIKSTMSFGNQWGELSQPVTAVVEAIDEGQPQQVGLSAMQLSNLALLGKQKSPMDANVLQRMVQRNKKSLHAYINYPPVTISANGVNAIVPVYNAFGHMATERPNGVRIGDNLATRLHVKVGDTITISS